MMNELRKTITTKQQMTTLRDQIRETFTLGASATVFSGIVADEKLANMLGKAIGQKHDKKMKTRIADDLVASMLGFSNTHEMFAHYNQLRTFNRETFIFSYRGEGSSVVEVYVEDGVDASAIDVAVMGSVFFEPNRGETLMKEPGSLRHEGVVLENVPSDAVMVSASDNVSGMTFMVNDVSSTPLLKLIGLTVKEIMRFTKEATDVIAEGGSFSSSEMTECIDRQAVDFFGMPQGAFASRKSAIHYLAGEVLGAIKGQDLPLQSSLEDSLNQYGEELPISGELDLLPGYEMFYDLSVPSLVVLKNKKTMYISSVSVTKTDPRGEKFRELF